MVWFPRLIGSGKITSFETIPLGEKDVLAVFQNSYLSSLPIGSRAQSSQILGTLITWWNLGDKTHKWESFLQDCTLDIWNLQLLHLKPTTTCQLQLNFLYLDKKYRHTTLFTICVCAWNTMTFERRLSIIQCICIYNCLYIAGTYVYVHTYINNKGFLFYNVYAYIIAYTLHVHMCMYIHTLYVNI